jgi:FtsH-binding integral membrane protein
MSENSSIWKRTGENTLSKNAYIRLISLFTIVVGGEVALGSVISYNWPFSWLLLIVTFIGSIGGICLFKRVSVPIFSFIGVSIMSLSLGLMIGPVLATYSTFVVVEAVLITGMIMVIMSIVGILFPRIFDGWGKYLMAALLALIICQFAQIIFMAIGFEQAADLPLLTWAGIILFTLFVAYDWSRALNIPYTLDNAIDVSGGLILDAVNLLIRVLLIRGGSKSSRS